MQGSKTIDSPTIDPQLAARYQYYPKKLIDKLLDLFIADIPKTEANITRAFHERKANLLAKYLHKLQGACPYCGLLRLEKTLIAFQAEIKNHCFLEARLAELKSELQQVIQARPP